MSAHTTGPWSVGKPFSDGRQMVTPIYAPDPACPTCKRGAGQWLIAWLHENAVSKKQRVANAALISAAPELLEQARRLQQAILQLRAQTWTDRDVIAMQGELDAVIAKATGAKS